MQLSSLDNIQHITAYMHIHKLANRNLQMIYTSHHNYSSKFFFGGKVFGDLIHDKNALHNSYSPFPLLKIGTFIIM